MHRTGRSSSLVAVVSFLGAFGPALALAATAAGNSSSPSGFVSLGSVVVFTARTAEAGLELWRSDGSGAGTYRLTDLCPGPCDAHVKPFAKVGRLYFFIGDDFALWRTDGTTAGTIPVTAPGVSPRQWVRPAWVPGLDRLFFLAADPEHGDELWSTDGTPSGTRLLVDLVPGPLTSGIEDLRVVGNQVFFFAAYARPTSSLWKTDGSPAGTRLLRGLPEGASYDPLSFWPAGPRALFLVNDGQDRLVLWRSDGTGPGTGPVATIAAEVPHQTRTTVLGGRMWIVGSAYRGPTRLWSSDGTAKGTRMVGTFASAEQVWYAPLSGGRAIFNAQDSAHGIEPWISDGSARGTHLLADICRGSCFDLRNATPIAKIGTRVLFVASDGLHGVELWSTDGTTGGTRMVDDLCPGDCSSDPSGFVDRGTRLAFAARVDGSRGLYETDGTAVGTRLLCGFGELPFAALRLEGASIGSVLLFAGVDESHGVELWRSNGTAAGTRMLSDLYP